MKKTVMFITLCMISFVYISCKKITTDPIDPEVVIVDEMRSVGPVLGSAYLWVQMNDQGTSVTIRFGASTGGGLGNGETILYDTQNNIEDISPTDEKNKNTYAFQTGTLTGSIEILDKSRVKVYFTQNVTPYTTLMEAVCEVPKP